MTITSHPAGIGERRPGTNATLWFWCLMGVLLASFKGMTAPQINTLEGDRIGSEGHLLVVRPINHATLALGWKDLVILVDPVGGAARFAGLPRGDLVLVTDIHQDHLNAETVRAVIKPGAKLGVPPAVLAQLPEDLKALATVLTNGQKATISTVLVEAVPAYNTSAERQRFHPRGRGNGYVITLGSKRVYVSGDTEDIPEMLQLKDIDVAFLCMNLPYTMDVERAAAAVRAFRPKIVYPYHCRGSDLQKFQRLVGNDIGVEVRIRDWYAP